MKKIGEVLFHFVWTTEVQASEHETDDGSEIGDALESVSPLRRRLDLRI